MKKKHKQMYIGIAAAELLLLLLCMLHGALSERIEISFGDMYEEPIPYEDAAIALERGSYLLDVSYETDSNDATIQAVVETSYGTVDGDGMPLIKGQTNKRIELVVREATDTFYIKLNVPDGTSVTVTEMTLTENGRMDRAFCFTLAAIFLLLDALLYLREKKIWENLSTEKKNVCVGLAVITILAIVPLLTNYLTRGHDFRFHVMRISGLAEALRTGQFPVRMQPLWLNDYGYPVSVMYGDLFLYIPALLRLCGFTLKAAYKVYIILVTMATAGISYYCVKNITDSRKIGLLGSFLYTLSFYRIVNVYIRSAVGEYTAMAFLPLVFLALYRIFHTEGREKRKYAVLLMLSCTAILQTHVLSFEMTMVFCIFYCLICGRMFWKNLWFLVKTALATILLNFSWLVPFADYMISHEMSLTDADGGVYMQKHGIFPAQLFQIFSFGSSLSGEADSGISADMPLGIGIALVLVFFVFVWQYLVNRRQLGEGMGEHILREQKRVCFLMAASVLMACWFFPWRLLGELPVIGEFLTSYQYPWRFLVMATVFGVFLAGYAVKNMERTAGAAAGHTFVLVLCIFTGISACSLYDRVMSSYSAEQIISEASFNSVVAIAGGEYLLEGADWYQGYDNTVEADEGIVVSDYSKEGCSIRMDLLNTVSEEQEIIVPLFAYKGFLARDTGTGETLEISADEDSMRISLTVPADYDGEVEIFFREPWYWRAAELISLIALILLLWQMVTGRDLRDAISKKNNK